MSQQPSYPMRRWNPTIHTNHASLPHAPCPTCYADCTSHDPGQLLAYTCPRGHAFTAYRSDGLNHAIFLARYYTGIQDNR